MVRALVCAVDLLPALFNCPERFMCRAAGRFIIKTQSKDESKLTRRMLHSYFEVESVCFVNYPCVLLRSWCCPVLIIGQPGYSFVWIVLQHMQAFPHSYINRIFGLHRVSIRTHGITRHIHFFVMNNVFCTQLKIHRVFDLKVGVFVRLLLVFLRYHCHPFE